MRLVGYEQIVGTIAVPTNPGSRPMPHRPPPMLRHPIRWLPCADIAEQDVEAAIDVVPMTWQSAWYWHRRVQPLIDQHYVKEADRRPEDVYAGVRADVGWRWPAYYALAAAWNRARPAAAPAERAVAWCVMAATDLGPIPVGMLTAVPAYASPHLGDEAKLGFVWYLSNAPAEHYQVSGLPQMFDVAYALLDIAIQSRLDFGEDAAIFLHADPAGGPKLIGFYEVKCGMTRLWHEKRLSPVRTVVPGEYFVMTAEQATTFCARFDEQRAE